MTRVWTRISRWCTRPGCTRTAHPDTTRHTWTACPVCQRPHPIGACKGRPATLGNRRWLA